MGSLFHLFFGFQLHRSILMASRPNWFSPSVRRARACVFVNDGACVPENAIEQTALADVGRSSKTTRMGWIKCRPKR